MPPPTVIPTAAPGQLIGSAGWNAIKDAIDDLYEVGSDFVPALSDLTVPTTAVNMNGKRLANLAEPTGDADAATKAYADSIAAGLDVKTSVRAATTANITLSGAQTIDGVSVIAGDRVLVKDQSTPANNGIYVAASGAWSRSTDADADAEVTTGMFTLVTEGTANAAKGFVLVSPGPITVGSTALSFTQFNQASPSTLIVQEEGSPLSTAATVLNFVGERVTASGSGATKTITTRTGGYTFRTATDPVASAIEGDTWLNTTTGVVQYRTASAWLQVSGSGGGADGYGAYTLPGLSLLDGLDWAPVFGRHPIVANFTPLRTVTVTNTATWNSAIADIQPGDYIRVTANLTSSINRVISNKDGTEANPWMIEFAPNVTLAGTSVNHEIQLLRFNNCDWFILKNVRMTSVNQVIWMRACNHVFYDSCQFFNIGQEAISWSDHCEYLDMWNCHFWDTGRRFAQFGEGIYVGTDENSGRWTDPAYSSDTSTYPYARYYAIRQCRFGRDVTREWVESKAGAQYGYLIGNTGDGTGWNNDNGGFSKAPFAGKGSDLFYFWNECLYPNEGMFHSYSANSAGTMGTGSWQQRHTWYGNVGHMDESTYGGANTKRLIHADAGKSHVVYDNNYSCSGAIAIVNTANITPTATPGE
jgi:hypothetical protein